MTRSDDDTLIPESPASAAGRESAGDRIDNYTLVEEIGEGGMGTVWRAQQSQPVEREVALKVIKLGMDTREVVARFQAERQALALMDHPSIARVFDAGATGSGRPYFAMELVAGTPITDFCNEQQLSVAERLALFRQVCHAVQHAHQKGVLHRDLKPANILVTRVDGKPVPKVIDFGIAKAIEKPLTDSSLATQALQIVGTPEYMPPEQASAKDVDTRADVYALGVVLYEILTGTRPFARTDAGLDNLGELLRHIHEVTPPKPSTRVSELSTAQTKTSVPSEHTTTIMARSLRGDLDWIVMKALEKDRERRYATALELADDVARHMANEPVLASPPSASYRLRKFVRRNRLAVAAGASVAVTLIVSTIALALLYTRALASEATASREAETSRQALDFMVNMFRVSDPSETRGETVTAREILDRGAERIEVELRDQPAIRSTLMATIGSVYLGLGLYARAEEMLSEAVQEHAQRVGDDAEQLRLSMALADVIKHRTRYTEAEELLRKIIAQQVQMLGAEHRETLESQFMLSEVLERLNKFAESERTALAALAVAERTLAGDDRLIIVQLLNQLGTTYLESGRFEESEEMLKRGLELARSVIGDDHPETLILLANLGELRMELGRYEDARACFEEAQATARRVYGDKHAQYLLHRTNYAILLFELEEWARAEEIQREILAIQREILEPDHADILTTLSSLGAAIDIQGRQEDAEPFYAEALIGLQRKFGRDHELTISATANIAIFYMNQGRLDLAEEMAREAYEASSDLLGDDHPATILRLENLSNVIYTQGDEAYAAEILFEVLERRRRVLGNEHVAVTRTLSNLALVFGNLGEHERALEIREELLERSLSGLAFDSSYMIRELEGLARHYSSQNQLEQAWTCVQEVLRIRRASVGDEDIETLTSMRDLLRCAVMLEDWPRIEPLVQEYYDAHVNALGANDPASQECALRIADGYEKQGEEATAKEWRTRANE